MATTLATVLTATIVDEQNVQAKAHAYCLVDPTAAFADFASLINEWITELDACIDGQITNVEIAMYPALPDGIKGKAAAGSRVEQTGVLMFSASGDTHNSAMVIPSVSNSSTVTGGGKLVLTPGAPISKYVSTLTAGSTADLEWTNANSQALVALTSSLISFREYREQLGRRSLET
jgi:hypothetical protein